MNLVLCYFTFFLPFWPFMNLFFFFPFLSFWLSCFICIKINWTNSRLRTPWGKYPTDLINHKVAESPPAPLCCAGFHTSWELLIVFSDEAGQTWRGQRGRQAKSAHWLCPDSVLPESLWGRVTDIYSWERPTRMLSWHRPEELSIRKDVCLHRRRYTSFSH